MKSEIRKTAAGTEYWDNEEKRVLFVPTGSEPNFEVTKNPKSMVAATELAKDRDKATINSQQVNISEDINLDEMDEAQLREFAKENNIELAFNVKKEETIRKNIKEALVAVEDE